MEISFSKSFSMEGVPFASLKNLNRSGMFSLINADLSIKTRSMICQYRSHGVLFMGVAVRNRM